MKLEIEIISKDRYLQGEAARYTFDETGGTIGRGTGCSWVLDDPNKYLSTTHLAVSWSARGFLVTDLSTNGTFRGHQRLTRGQADPKPLAVGDELVLGQVRLRVSNIWQSADTQIQGTLAQTPEARPFVDADLISHQNRLAEVLGQAFPQVDHGVELRQHLAQQAFPMQFDLPPAMPASGLSSAPADVQPLEVEQSAALLELLLQVILRETQRQLAVDRIDYPTHFQTMDADNIFRQAANLKEMLALDSSHDRIKADLQHVLQYFIQGPSR